MWRILALVSALLAPVPVAPPAVAAADGETAAAPTARRAEVVLAVENMTCPSCPYIVKRALAAVAGVTAVEVDFASGTARVVYDPAVAGIGDLTAATAAYGYPSRPLGGDGAS